MSIIRLTLIKNRLYAPTGLGALVDTKYTQNNGSRRGLLEVGVNPSHQDSPPESALTPSSELFDYLQFKASSEAADYIPGAAPVTVMVHGFLYDPRDAVTGDPKETDNPHGRNFHFKERDELEEIRHHTTSWPRQLGFRRTDKGKDGVAIAFGWYSQPGFASSIMSHYQNYYARAYDLGRQAAWPLLRTLQSLTDLKKFDSQPIDIFCHSLASVVVIGALTIAAANKLPLLSRIGRVILLGGSEYTDDARNMYTSLMRHAESQQWPEKKGPQFYNIESRENAVLDVFAENFGPRGLFSPNSQVIGHNRLEARKPTKRWIDLQIDGDSLMRWLADHDLHISGDNPEEWWDHWYYYTHRGNMKFYCGILRDRSTWSISKCRQQGCPERLIHVDP